ncbi:MAG TPA: hypothetical protein VFQ23_14140 [Anaerolineales bacterium]|nr:hypothetical protein [Anaerolineales bacterium]
MKSFLLALFLLCLVLLNACTLPLTPTSLPPTVTATSTQTATATPPTYGGCGYQWANQPLPELSAEFQNAIQLLQPEAQANAFAFGEDCVHADGTTRTFIAMETDFNVTLQVNDLSDESALGDWIVKIMDVIENIPPEKIMGPRPGRVSVAFQVGSEQKYVNFYVDQYQALPSGLSSTEIYQALQTPQ